MRGKDGRQGCTAPNRPPAVRTPTRESTAELRFVGVGPQRRSGRPLVISLVDWVYLKGGSWPAGSPRSASVLFSSILPPRLIFFVPMLARLPRRSTTQHATATLWHSVRSLLQRRPRTTRTRFVTFLGGRRILSYPCSYGPKSSYSASISIPCSGFNECQCPCQLFSCPCSLSPTLSERLVCASHRGADRAPRLSDSTARKRRRH